MLLKISYLSRKGVFKVLDIWVQSLYFFMLTLILLPNFYCAFNFFA